MIYTNTFTLLNKMIFLVKLFTDIPGMHDKWTSYKVVFLLIAKFMANVKH